MALAGSPGAFAASVGIPTFFPTTVKWPEVQRGTMTTKVDDRGRVVIPKELREQAGIGPGQDVRVELDEDGRLVIQPVLSAAEFLDRMVGAVNEETRKEDAEPIDPLELKKMWEPFP